MTTRKKKERLGFQTSEYSDKTLKLLTNEIGDYFSEDEAIEATKDYCKSMNLKLVANYDILAKPFINGATVIDTILKFIKSKKNKDKLVSEFIEDILHPLNFNADESKVHELADKIENIIKYDKFYLTNHGSGYEYAIYTESEWLEFHELDEYDEESLNHQLKEEEKSIRDNKNIYIKLSDYYKTLIDFVKIFCDNPNILNDNTNNKYLFLKKKISKLSDLVTTQPNHPFTPYFPFYNDLFSSEAEWLRNNKGKIMWEKIRPYMYSSYSDLNKILQVANSQVLLNDDNAELEDIKSRIINYEAKRKELFESKINIKKLPNEDDVKSYITKNSSGNFEYLGRLIDISKDNDSYKLFSILFTKRPTGGFITYDEIIEEMKTHNSLKKTNNYSKKRKINLIQNSLTGKLNGFIKYAKIPLTLDNQKRLIKTVRAKSMNERGIEFNNSMK